MGAAAGVGAGAARTTSSWVMCPSGPVPCTALRSTPSWWARCRTGGVARGPGDRIDDAAAVGVPIIASGVPTGTWTPVPTRISVTTPSSNASISMAAFAVSTTATIWPRRTASPGLTSHSTIVPTSMSAPSEGIRNSPMVQASPRIARRAAAAMPSTVGSAASSRCRE